VREEGKKLDVGFARSFESEKTGRAEEENGNSG
jgi:hypothetical protein